MEYVILAVMSFGISIISAFAGGGGGLIMIPVALLLGFPPQVVLASDKAGALATNAGALSKFVGSKEMPSKKWLIVLSVMAVAAAVIGTQVVLRLDGDTLKSIIGFVIIALVPIMLFSGKIGLKNRVVKKWQIVLGMIAYFVIMVGQAGIGSGIGTLLMFVMMGLFGFSALRASATSRAVGLVLLTISFTIFAFTEYMNWLFAASVAVPAIFGGRLGAHIALKRGNLFVKRALLAVAFIMGVVVLLT